MQRIEPDAGRPQRGGEFDQVREIGEIAVAPIAARAHPIELRRQRPGPSRRAIGALIGLLRQHARRRLRPCDRRSGAARRHAVEDARKHLRLHHPAAAEAVDMLRFDAPLGRTLENAVHLREGLQCPRLGRARVR